MSEQKSSQQQSESVPKELQSLLVKQEAARAQVRTAEADLAKHRAELANLKAEIIRADKNGYLFSHFPGYVFRW